MIVKVQQDFTAKSKAFYSFVDPHINSIEPSKGPKAGGTRLTIWGLHMDAGSHAEAYLGTCASRLTLTLFPPLSLSR